jgi:2-dehydropantoate 2-reductase
MAVALANGLEGLARDAELLDLVRRACREGVAIARRIGRPEALSPLAPLAAGPIAMRATVAALKRLSPEALFYVDEHFGRKLREQHRTMARGVVEVARERDLPHAALDELARRLEPEARIT